MEAVLLKCLGGLSPKCLSALMCLVDVSTAFDKRLLQVVVGVVLTTDKNGTGDTMCHHPSFVTRDC